MHNVERKSRSAAKAANSRGWFARLGMSILAALVLVALPQSAEAWWNDEWQLRKKITVDTSASGANITDQIGTMAVLVRLHVGNFRFGQAKETGDDLRFVASDDKTPLKFHIEKYDSLLGEAFAWVQVPNLSPGQKSDFWLYYGNKKAQKASDPKATYDADTVLVYHFAERGSPAQDSSVWANGAQSAGQPADGSIVGTGLRLTGQAPITLPAAPSLMLPENGSITWSAWIKPAAPQPNAAIYSRHDGGRGFVIGLDNGSPFVEVLNGSVQRTTNGAPVAMNSWHHLAMAAANGTITLYLDGTPYATLSAQLPALNSTASLGGGVISNATPAAPSVEGQAPAGSPADAAAPSTDGATQPAGEAATAEQQAAGATPDAAAAQPAPAPAPAAVVVTSAGFAGDLDELSISKIARPAGFIKAETISQGPDQAKFITFSVDEETASWLSGYFAVILRSVTIDGWVVIGFLVVLSVISWFVMIGKTSLIRKQARANEEFLKSYRVASATMVDLSKGEYGEINQMLEGLSTGGEKTFKNSSLYQIFKRGAAEIAARHAGPNDGQRRILADPSIAAIRASLDAVMVRESQKLNRMMVMLTIAISGGPFLGLLGTVVGVMITFAAIAESGDVNVNAIAPGIAAALVATVAGLAVAIPALFGYNYLTSRIKDVTSDMRVFVDEFVTRMAELHADRPAPAPLRIAAE